MTRYRKRLPQLQNRLFVTDGGLETTLIFNEGIALPCFASFDLLKDDTGWGVLRRYFATYAEIACTNKAGLVLETPRGAPIPTGARRSATAHPRSPTSIASRSTCCWRPAGNTRRLRHRS